MTVPTDYMRLYDAEKAKALATYLRDVATRIDAGEVKYLAVFVTHTLEGAKRHGFAFDQQYDFIETIGSGEFALVLGGLRSFYLDVEMELMRRWAHANSSEAPDTTKDP